MADRREWIARAALAAWLVGTSALGGVLLIRHMIALPTPPLSDRALRDALTAELPDAGWRVAHVMYRACPCSRRTIDHLVAGPRPSGVRELVLVVDDKGEPGPEDGRLAAAGFRVLVITPDELHRRYDLEAAPVMVVLSPAGELAYIGGYNRHKQSPAYQDVAIIADLQGRETVSTLPVFGCATSKRLARLVDPLGLAGSD
jgi:hypothetical protein